MNFDDVQKIRETQRSLAKRFDENKQLINEQIVELLGTENAKNLDIARLTEIESIIFKLKAELIDYIEEHGLVDGLIWNGVLQPVQGSKIVITKDMIQAITDSIYTKELKKLAGIEEGAEANKVIDVIFNDVSVLDNDTRVATITITPEDIKLWYESNPDTNAYTDEEKELVATIPTITDDIQNIEEEQTKQNERLDALEESQDEQDTRLDTIEAEQIEQNNRLDEVEPKVEKNIEDIANIKLEQTEQNTRLTNIETEQVTQNNRLDSIELEQTTQNANIELNKTNIEINKANIETNKTNLEQEIEERKHADEDIKVIYDAEIKRIDQVNEHLQHEVDQKVKDVLLDGISVCDENRNAQLKSNDISKILDVKVDGESVVNSDKVAEIDTSDICKVKDVEVDGKTVVENHIAKIDTTDFCKVKDVTVDGETVVNPDTKVAEIDLSDTKIDTATQINIDGSTSDILSVDSEGNRNITVNASELGVLEDVTLDGESTIRYSNASGGRTAVINSKVKDVQLDGKSIVDSDKVANIDTSTFGKVDDVKIDGESVVVDKVANIDLKPYENEVTDVEVGGQSIISEGTTIAKIDTYNFDGIDLHSLNDKAIRGVEVDGQSVVDSADMVAKLSSSSFGEIKDVTVDGTTIVDKDTKIANLDTTNLGGVNLTTLKSQVDTNTADIKTNSTNIKANSTNIATNASDISAIKTEQATQNTNIEKNTNDIAGLSANYEELAVDVNNNTNDISSNTTRIASLEQLQSLVPSSADEADVLVVTPLNDANLSGMSALGSSQMLGFNTSTNVWKFGSTLNLSQAAYNFKIFETNKKIVMFKEGYYSQSNSSFKYIYANPEEIAVCPSYFSGVQSNSAKAYSRSLVYHEGLFKLGTYRNCGVEIYTVKAWYINIVGGSETVTYDTDVNVKLEYYKFLPPTTTTANSLSSDGIALANETEEVNNVEYITIPAVPDGFYDEMKADLLASGLTEEEANAQIEAQKERQAKAEEEARARQTENV